MAVQYYYSDNGANQQGPVSLDQLRDAKIKPETLVWRDGLPNWVPAQTLPELGALFGGPVVEGVVETPPPAAQAEYPQYPQPSPQPHVNYQTLYPASQSNNGMAVASMICGIVGIVGGCLVIPSILAIIFGHIARGQIRQGQGTGDGMAVAGLWMGYLWTGLTLLIVVGYFLFIVVILGAAAAGAASSPQSF